MPERRELRMVLRKIVKIDETRCNGCGSCIPKCAEGALKIVDGKARILSDVYCDGLGACLGHCPQDAITIVEREAPDFSEEAVKHHKNATRLENKELQTVFQWPVKLNLVPLRAPFYENADLLIAADCAPVAHSGFRESWMPGRRLIIGCPKFDDARAYAQKLGEILRQNNVATITIVHMEVPCCSGLNWAVDKALEASGKKIPVKRYEITVRGEVNEL
jgi:Pyruvate/2-oxoacid:ferredoxin oxidoreductase delta subunit